MNVAQRNPGRGNGPRPNAAQREQDIIDLTSSDSDMSDSEDEFFEAPAIPQRHAANANPPAAAAQPQQNAAAQQPVADVPPDPMLGPAVWGDYVIDDDFDDEMIARAMDMDFAFQPRDQFQPPPAPEPRQAEALSSSYDPPAMQAAQPMEDKVQVVDTVVAMFPGICRDHVSELYGTISQHSDRLIAHILDKMERGTQYPKAKDKQNILKRKREVDEDEEAARKYTAVDRKVPDAAGGLRQYIRNILSNEFPETPCAFIDATLNQSGYRLFSAYRVLEEAHRTFDPQRPPYNKIKKSRAPNDAYSERNIEMFISTIDVARQQEKADILRELQAARRVRRKADAKRASERQAELEEEANLLRAQEEGTTQECGCCFGDYPLNRMVHCDNDEMHWFCRGCAKRNAETEIGNSKYELNCMSMDGCESGFSHEQRSQFLDENTIVALERNEQEAVLRLAGIENLASCPFCPFAAEYPLVEVDREFRCQAPDCEKISCRLCKLESHIPKSCEENAKDNGLSVRRQIEEAMSAAMIRKCNKCGTPFVKEEGCNKMTCTRNGCYNVQCYVCSKSCQYDHFNDRSRGGKEGNCPLFEKTDERHDLEVKEAERIALEKVRAEHPEYSEEDLKIKISDAVLKDDERRRSAVNDPRAHLQAMRVARPGGPRHRLGPVHRYPRIPPGPQIFGAGAGPANGGVEQARLLNPYAPYANDPDALPNNYLNQQLWGQNPPRPEDFNPFDFADPALFHPFGVANDNNNANANQYPNLQIVQAQAQALAAAQVALGAGDQDPAQLQGQLNGDPFDIWWQPPVPNVARGNWDGNVPLQFQANSVNGGDRNVDAGGQVGGGGIRVDDGLAALAALAEYAAPEEVRQEREQIRCLEDAPPGLPGPLPALNAAPPAGGVRGGDADDELAALATLADYADDLEARGRLREDLPAALELLNPHQMQEQVRHQRDMLLGFPNVPLPEPELSNAGMIQQMRDHARRMRGAPPGLPDPVPVANLPGGSNAEQVQQMREEVRRVRGAPPGLPDPLPAANPARMSPREQSLLMQDYIGRFEAAPPGLEPLPPPALGLSGLSPAEQIQNMRERIRRLRGPPPELPGPLQQAANRPRMSQAEYLQRMEEKARRAQGAPPRLPDPSPSTSPEPIDAQLEEQRRQMRERGMAIADDIPGWGQQPRQEADDVWPEMRRATEVVRQNEECMRFGEQFMMGNGQGVIRMKNGAVFGPAEGGNAFVMMKNMNPNANQAPTPQANLAGAMANQNPAIPNNGVEERRREAEQRRRDIGQRQRQNLQQEQRIMQERRERRLERGRAEAQREKERERARVKEERGVAFWQEAEAEHVILEGLFPARVRREREDDDLW